MNDALLIYPRLGSMDSIVLDPPLSIIYAAAAAVKRGYRIELMDLRCEVGDWHPLVDRRLRQGVRLVGISVMTGVPLRNARDISRYIRKEFPHIPIVWGGPHVTVLPDTVAESFIDYVVRGDGSHALAQLIQALREGRQLGDIAGLSFKGADGVPVHVPRSDSFEHISYLDIPYHLLDMASAKYQRLYRGERVFPIFTTMGCPYKCTFCISPALYSVVKGKRWIPLDDDEVIAHIRFLIDRYEVKHFCVIDDTSFVDIQRMRRLFNRIIDEAIHVSFEFRGARINEIDKMDDEFLSLMVKAGGRSIMVGVESASNRLLEQMQKGIRREHIIRVNRKLARHPSITPHYNFFYGMPGETYDDVVVTKDTILQILQENPHAYFGVGGDWKPIPGTQMLEVAEKEYDYKAPQTMDEWIEMDSFDSRKKIVHPWYTVKHNNIIKAMQLSAYVVDNKIIRESQGNNAPWFVLLRLLSRLYKPIAVFRLRNNFYHFMIDFELYRWLVRIISAIKSS